MKKIKMTKLTKLFIAVTLLLLCVTFNTYLSLAKGASVEVNSTDTAEVGDDFSVTVSISGGDISAYTVYVTYDSSVLTFNGGSGAILNGGGGTVTISGTSEANVSLSFTAATDGESGIYTSGEFYDLDMNELDTSYGSAYVEVGNNGETTEKTTEKTTEATEDTRSSNCNLYTLEVSEGVLTPEFNTSTTYYEMQVAEDVTYIEVSAYPADNKASVSVSDNDNLEPGENHIYITCTAENGDYRVYTIRVVAGELIGDNKVTINGINYSLLDDYSGIYDYINIPEGYEEVKVSYDKWKIPAFSYNENSVYIVCLKDGQGSIDQFVYDEKNQRFYRYVEYYINDNRYLITDMHEDVKLGDNFKEAVLKIEGEEIKAAKSDDLDKDCYIIYALNLDGDSGLYIFDSIEGNMMRFTVIQTPTDASASDASPSDVTTETEPATETFTTEQTEGATEETEDAGMLTKKQFIMFLVIVGVVFLVLLLLVIFFAFRFKAIRAENEGQNQAEKFVDELWNLDGEEKASDKETDDSGAEAEEKPDDSAAEADEKADDSAAEAEKKPDDSVAETEEKPDDSVAETEEKPDDSVAETEKKSNDSGVEGGEDKAADTAEKEAAATDSIDELTKKIDKLIEANQVMWADEKAPEEEPKKKKSSFEMFDAD